MSSDCHLNGMSAKMRFLLFCGYIKDVKITRTTRSNPTPASGCLLRGDGPDTNLVVGETTEERLSVG